MVKVGSPFTMFYFLAALEREGYFEKVVDIIHDYWGIMIDQDAKTCWETVSQDYLNGKSPYPTRSHCHAWSSAPLDMFTRIILGVVLLEPGFQKVKINPQTCGLKFAQGSIPTPYGMIKADWKKTEGKNLELKVEAPPEINVIISLFKNPQDASF